jgi:adenosylcobinamide-phosphate synthase
MTILIALLWDWLIGEPPVWCHPVVWFGNYLTFAEKPNTGGANPQEVSKPSVLRVGGQQDRSRLKINFLLGAVTWMIGCTIVLFATGAIAWGIGFLPLIGRILITGLLLKPAFAFRMLVREVAEIEQALQQDLDQGRKRLAYIVSRDTTNLSAIEVRESALESISENLSDSVIAPLFYFLLFGLPGAYVYRFINTADAMWGYRNEKYEWWGKWAARADDVANWIPARLTGLWLYWVPILVEPDRKSPSIGGFRGPVFAYFRSIKILRQEAHKTPSPNSGWSMAAFALRLNVHLGKPGVYILNEKGNDLDAETTIAGITWITRAGLGLTALLALISLLRFELPKFAL